VKAKVLNWNKKPTGWYWILRSC